MMNDGGATMDVNRGREITFKVISIFLVDTKHLENAQFTNDETVKQFKRLELLTECFSQLPQIFVCSNGSDNDEKELCHKTTNFLMNSLLNILSKPTCHVFHSIIITLLEKLLGCFFISNGDQFKKLIQSLFLILKDVIVFNEDFLDNEETSSHSAIWFTSDIDVPEKPELSSQRIPVTFSNSDQCDMFKHSILKILTRSVDQWLQVLRPVNNKGLWDILLSVLKTGNISCKTSALEIVDSLLETYLPSSAILDDLLYTMIELLQLLCSPTLEVAPIEKQKVINALKALLKTLSEQPDVSFMDSCFADLLDFISSCNSWDELSVSCVSLVVCYLCKRPTLHQIVKLLREVTSSKIISLESWHLLCAVGKHMNHLLKLLPPSHLHELMKEMWDFHSVKTITRQHLFKFWILSYSLTHLACTNQCKDTWQLVVSDVLSKLTDFVLSGAVASVHEFELVVEIVAIIIVGDFVSSANLVDERCYESILLMLALARILPSERHCRDFSLFDLKKTKQRIHFTLPLTPVALKAIMLLPANCCATFRLELLENELVAGKQNDDGVIAAVNSVPFMILSNKKIARQLLTSLQRLSIGELVVTSFLHASQDVICSTCEHAAFHWMTTGEHSLVDHFRLQCSVCQGQETPSQSTLIPLSEFRFLLSYTNSDSVSTRLAVAKIVSVLFRHYRHLNLDDVDHDNLVDVWLKLMLDNDFTVGQASSLTARHLRLEKNSELGFLRKITDLLDSDASPEQQMNLLQVLCNLASTCSKDLQSTSILRALEMFLSSSAQVSTAAWEQIQDLKEHDGVDLQKTVLMERKSEVCVLLAKHLINLSDGDRIQFVDQSLLELSLLFGFQDVSAFLQRIIEELVAVVVSYRSLSSTPILRNLARFLELSRKKLLVTYTASIVSHFVCKCPETEFDSLMNFLAKETDFELSELVRYQSLPIMFQLLVCMSEYQPQVERGFNKISQFLNISKGSLKEILRPRFLGLLALFDQYIVSRTVSLKAKGMAFGSLSRLMEIMGEQDVTWARVKILTTLRSGLQFDVIQDQCLSAWYSYVTNIEVESLGSLLSQICISLLPYLDKAPGRMKLIFEYLIVEKKDALKGHFCELYFLDNVPQLRDVFLSIKPFTESPRNIGNLRKTIFGLMKSIVHDNTDIRNAALHRLGDIVDKFQKQVQDLILRSETPDPVICELLPLLVSASDSSDPQSKLLCASCIGLIGALDPGRLSPTTGSRDESSFLSSVSDVNFAHSLMMMICNRFIASLNSRSQDGCAYALQSLLTAYAVNQNSPKGSDGEKLWSRFDNHIKDILMPLQTSNYTLTFPVPDVKFPLFGTRNWKAFPQWLSTWVPWLISRIRLSQPKAIFTACLPVLKEDTNTSWFLLPHIIVNLLLENNPADLQLLRLEIETVLDVVGNGDSSTDLYYLGTQTIFNALDYLKRWVLERKKGNNCVSERSSSRSPPDELNKRVTLFIEAFSDLSICKAAYNCSAFCRALLYAEQHIKKQDLSPEILNFLQKIYVALTEPDGVSGVAYLRNGHAEIHDQILVHEGMGDLGEAAACYENAVASDDLETWVNYLSCLMDLGRPNTVLRLSDGLASQNPNWIRSIRDLQVEASVKLSDWDGLETLVKNESLSEPGCTESLSWSFGLGKLLLNLKQGKSVEFDAVMKTLRLDLLTPLSAVNKESGSYQRGYPSICRLHVLSEVEKVSRMFNESGEIALDTVLEQWSSRLTMIEPSYKRVDALLSVRRALFGIMKFRCHLPDIDLHVGHTWLASAKAARITGLNETAYSAYLQVENLDLPELHLEKAKWLWEKGLKDQARLQVDRALCDYFDDTSKMLMSQAPTGSKRSNRELHGEALFLRAQYNQDMLDSNQILSLHKDVIKVHPTWENGVFHLAKYYEKILDQLGDRPERRSQLIKEIITYLGQTLCIGCEHVYEAAPLMLSYWLDFGNSVVSLQNQLKKPSTQLTSQQLRSQQSGLQKIENHLTDINAIISSFIRKIPKYAFMICFQQLISRICHPERSVATVLHDLIAYLTSHHSMQAMWMLIPVLKSSHEDRSAICKDILQSAKVFKPSLLKYIRDCIRLSDELILLCNFIPSSASARTMSLKTHFKKILRMLSDPNFSKLLIPLQSSMTVNLPGGKVSGEHDAYPGPHVYWQSIEDQIDVLSSLQKPKKINVRGSDGRLYPMMCKPKDDLRKDNRLLEFNTMINKFLKKDSESRSRRLYIRTYCVTPLNEECGLIEWVPHMTPYRHILKELYHAHGVTVNSDYLKQCKLPANARKDDKLLVFRDKLLGKHPPVFSEWFCKTFTDPVQWYSARLAYTRTCAVMSIVGYILGLGDRHGENILLDSNCGDVLHVDFNCLFNKAETFEYPEIVPFRLTRNMVEAMGPTGVEGIFRRTCEITLRLMCDRKDPLMNVLKTFLYDPLLEFSRAVKSEPMANEKAQSVVVGVQQRLKGIAHKMGRKRDMPLSVEGHVNFLIKEATSEENLAQMYIGWSPFY